MLGVSFGFVFQGYGIWFWFLGGRVCFCVWFLFSFFLGFSFFFVFCLVVGVGFFFKDLKARGRVENSGRKAESQIVND